MNKVNHEIYFDLNIKELLVSARTEWMKLNDVYKIDNGTPESNIPLIKSIETEARKIMLLRELIEIYTK